METAKEQKKKKERERYQNYRQFHPTEIITVNILLYILQTTV